MKNSTNFHETFFIQHFFSLSFIGVEINEDEMGDEKRTKSRKIKLVNLFDECSQEKTTRKVSEKRHFNSK